jgi:hypothetical protein
LDAILVGEKYELTKVSESPWRVMEQAVKCLIAVAEIPSVILYQGMKASISFWAGDGEGGVSPMKYIFIVVEKQESGRVEGREMTVGGHLLKRAGKTKENARRASETPTRRCR